MQLLNRQAGRQTARNAAASKRAARAPARASRSAAVHVRAVAAPVAPTTTTTGDDMPYRMSDVVMWSESKRIQTQVLPVAEDTITIRSLDWDRDRFDIEFGLENGTTYNAYLIYGADKTALVDASHEKFHNLFLEALQKELQAAGRSLDYVFVSHTEPDHSGLIPAVLDLYPEATVCGSKVCISFLQNLTHREQPFDADVKVLMPHYRFYYDCLMKPNAKSVTTALRKVKDLPYTMIANGHGPILRYNVSELVGDYGRWSAALTKGATSVAVLYASDYGFSDRLSQTLAKGITKARAPDIPGQEEIVAAVGRSSGIVLMSPPRDNADARTSLAAVSSAIKAKTKVVIAESYGGRDEPVDVLAAQLQDALTAKESIARKKAAMSGEVAKALARLSSGLYVVTAQHNNARSAMIASWVSQASFEPLGLTIAVAKDRAIESLMQVGDSFVLNCLGEDNYAPVMKHFLQRFAPGADRFEGVDWSPAPTTNCPVLSDAIAYMECRVASRLETPDHWVTYCEVINGSVTNTGARTAVHRRKVANYY
eukprot:XP_001699345.1 flavoprotein [Chlamydomonas reinhardtii]